MAIKLKENAFVKELKGKRIEREDLIKFQKNMNVCLKNREFRKEFGFTEHSLNEAECLDLLKKLFYVNSGKKSIFKVIPIKIKDIPKKFFLDFQKKTRAADDYMKFVRAKHEICFGAFYDENLVGFIIGSEFQLGERKVIALPYCYVPEQYSGYGIATRLHWRMLAEAKKRDLDGISMGRMLTGTEYIFYKLKKEWGDIKNPKLVFELDETEEGHLYGDI